MDELTQKTSSGSGILGWIERVGNRLPDPVTLFFTGALLVLIAAEIAATFDWQVENPVVRDEQGELKVEKVTRLFSSEGVHWIWTHVIGNFTSFPPLGVVLVAMLGIGVAERSGLIGALLKAMMSVTPQVLLTPAVIFIGIMSNMASDAGYVVLPPLAAAMFARAGRSPLVGLAAVFAGVSAGFSANLLVTALDPLLQSFTQSAAEVLDPNYVVDVRCNYYFMIASTVVMSLVGWLVTCRFVEPRFSKKDVDNQIAVGQRQDEADESKHLSPSERRGLWWALIAGVIAAVIIVAMVVLDGWSLNGEAELRKGLGIYVPKWIGAIVPLLAVLFFVPGIAYGIATGAIRTDRDIAKMMAETMRAMGPYVLLAFAASQFVAWFSHSNLGLMVALQGAALLKSINMPMLLVICIVLLTAVLNVFLGSASAKWALFSIVFVPMFMAAGISPELTQAAYRVGDSVTNCITPLNPYMVIILVFMQRYLPRAGVGSLISLMLPYTIAFTIAWCILLSVWMILGIPLGPGAQMFIEPL